MGVLEGEKSDDTLSHYVTFSDSDRQTDRRRINRHTLGGSIYRASV